MRALRLANPKSIAIAELTKNICVTANKPAAGTSAESDESGVQLSEEGELSEFFPPFVWLLRDFSLHMKKVIVCTADSAGKR